MVDFLRDKVEDSIYGDVIPMFDQFDHKPFVPLKSPGLSAPGDFFVAHAEAILGAAIDEDGKALLVERMHRAALYDTEFYLPIKVKGKYKVATFVPGHLIGQQYNRRGPDQLTEVGVVVIGKCPASEEQRTHRNMAGKNGELFFRLLDEAGVPKEEYEKWYVTNLVKHPHLDPSSKQLAASWIKNCKLLVEMELRLLRPKFVLCLGSEASKWMVGGDIPGGPSASHGMVLTKQIPLHQEGEEPRWHEFSAMTCLQPAAVIHSSDSLPQLRQTILRFSQLVAGTLDAAADVEQLDHKTIYTEDELASVVDQIIAEHYESGLSSQPIAIDCEWHGDYWSSCHRTLKGDLPGGRIVPELKGEPESWLRTIQFSHRPGFARAIVLRHGGRRSKDGNDLVGLPAFVPSIDAAIKQLKRLFTETPGRQVILSGHYLKSDLPWLIQLDQELGDILVKLYDAPEDDPDPDGVNRLYAWQKLMIKGGFDTLYGSHSIQETAEKKLEVVAMNLCGLRRYDGPLQKEKKAICTELNIAVSALNGFGEVTDEVLLPYSMLDVDGTSRILRKLTKPGGLLDKDQYGNISWRPMQISQAKLTAELEMEMNGVLIDHRRAEKLTQIYSQAGKDLLKKLQQLVGWEDVYEDGKLLHDGLNPRSAQQVRTLLFGSKFSGKINKDTGEIEDPRPDWAKDSLVLGLTPIKTTSKPPTPWERVKHKGNIEDHQPSTDKESLGIMLARAIDAKDEQAADVLRTLRYFRFINRVTTSVLCPPKDGEVCGYDEDGNLEFAKGLMASVETDHRVRTRFSPIDTGRCASWGPGLQNLSKRREVDMKAILGDSYSHPLRSIITVPDGWVIVSADFSGAELAVMAIQSNSAKMVDHCKRSAFAESDPRHYDIHSQVAVKAFKLTCEPTKGGLKKAGLGHLRDIAKIIAFRLAYSGSASATARSIEEVGLKVGLEDVADVRDALFQVYPELERFFLMTKCRVQAPGFITNSFGRHRRFQRTSDVSPADLERIAGNFIPQSEVADCTSTALRLLKHFPGRHDEAGQPKYKLMLQIHDDVSSEVRIEHLDWYIDTVLPACMTDGVVIYPSDLDGKRIPGKEGVHLGFEVTLAKSWGEAITEEVGRSIGLPERYLTKRK